MSQVSKNILNNRVYERIFSLFPQLLHRMIARNQENDLVKAFFTRTEKIIFAKRVAIAFMLVKGYTYQQIVTKIKVSYGTVSRISDVLRTNGSVVASELDSIAKEDAFLHFLNAIDYHSERIMPPKGNQREWRKIVATKKKQLKPSI